MPGAVSSLMLRLMGDNSDAEAAVEGVGTKVGALVGTLAGAATAALGIGAAFKSAMEVTAAQGNIAGKLGIDPAEAKKLASVAGTVYANAWGDSLAEVSDAVVIVKQDLNDLAADSEIEGITTKALALSQAFGVDLGQAVQGVGQLIRTGMVKDANEGMDLVTVAFQTMGQRGDDVLDTLKEYPVAFQALGLTGAQAIGLMRQGLSAGARDSDIIADALKEFALIAKSGSTSAAAGFQALGLNAKKMTTIFAKGGAGAAAGLNTVLEKLRAMKDPTARNAAAVALFGTKAEDLQAALFALNPATAAKGLGDVAGAADKMTAAVGTSPQATLESFKRKVEVALGESLAKSVPAMQSSLDKFAPMIPQIVSGITSVLNVAVPVLTSVLGFLAPYTPALTQIAVVAGGVKLAMMGWGAISGVVGTVGASVRAANTALTLFRAGVAGAQATQLATAGQRIANVMGLAARNVGMAAVATGRWVATQAVAAAGGIRTAASVVATNVAIAAQNTWLGIIRVATLIWTGVQWLLNASFYGFPLVWIIAAIIAVVAIIVLIATKTTWFQTIWKFVWGAIVAYFNFVVGIIKGAFTALVWIFVTWLPGVIRGFWGFIVNIFLGIHNFIMTQVMRVIVWLRNLGDFFFIILPARIRAAVSSLISVIAGFVTSIWQRFTGLIGRIANIGRDIVVGLWNGITGMGGWLWNKVTGFAQNILTTMMHALGVHSPSRKAADMVGKPVAEGVAKGMVDNVGAVETAAAMMASSAIPDARTLAAASAGAAGVGGAGAAGGGDIYVTVPLQVDGMTLAQVILKVNRRTGVLKELVRS